MGHTTGSECSPIRKRNAMTTKGRYGKKTVTPTVPDEGTPKRLWKATFRRYINYTPTDKQKEEFHSWADDENLYVLVEWQASLGRQFSVSYDPRAECFQATLFERDEESINAGYIASARGQTAALAMLRVLWYVTVVFPDDWNALISPTAKDLW